MAYFKNVGTLEELRRQYKELLKKHHPDNGGNVADMQEINVEYDRLFKVMKDKHEHRSESDTEKQSDFSKMKYDFTEDQKLRDILYKIVGFDGIVIEIAGAWIWVSGDTYAYKKELKETGFKWASQKKCCTGIRMCSEKKDAKPLAWKTYEATMEAQG